MALDQQSKSSWLVIETAGSPIMDQHWAFIRADTVGPRKEPDDAYHGKGQVTVDQKSTPARQLAESHAKMTYDAY